MSQLASAARYDRIASQYRISMKDDFGCHCY